MKDYAYRKSPWRFLFLGIAAIGGVRLLYDGVVSLIGYFILHRELVQNGSAAAIGIIGGADGPTAIFVTTPAWTRPAWMAALLIVGVVGYLLLRRCKARSK